MEFLCYHRDRTGSTPLRHELVEEHWSYMDRFAATMVARGPTYTDDGTLTGSVHVLDLPDATAARAFAFEEPGWQAGAYRDVLVRRWRGSSPGTVWDFVGRTERDRYLVLGFTHVAASDAEPVPTDEDVILSGHLLSDDGALAVGAAVLLEADSEGSARDALPAEQYAGVEVHRWRPGGRPS